MFTMLASAVFIQVTEVVIDAGLVSHYAVPPPVLWAFVLLTFLCALVFAVTRWRLLTRAELLCVLFATLMSAPLVSQGFWQRMVSASAILPRAGDFERLDMLPEALWPHGPNLLDGAFEPPAAEMLVFRGAHAWETIEYEADQTARLPVLTNTRTGEVALLRIRVPLTRDGQRFLRRNEPYLVTVLARARDLEAGSRYFGRVYEDDRTDYEEIFNTDAPEKVTYLRQRGFQRQGLYGLILRPEVREHVWLEFGLQGLGRLELWDPKLMSVGALERAYQGRFVVDEDRYQQLPEGARSGLLVRPRTLWSLAGLKYLATGYVEVVDWLPPLFGWGGFLMLLLAGSLALAVIMRRQWFDRERFPMPVAQAISSLADTQDTDRHALPPIWRNRMMWTGLAITFIWTLLKAWAFYNPKVPDLSVKIFLGPYFSDPSWGTMFAETRFEINAIFLAICGFMELNVLLSFVVGYWLFRCLGWLGVSTGWNGLPNYPFAQDQGTAAFITYAILMIVLTRKHWARVLRAAWQGDRAASEGEVMSYRGAVLLLVAALAGCWLWAVSIGVRPAPMLLFFGYCLLVVFVSMRIRAECGLPWGYFMPGFEMVMVLAGGVSTFGSGGTMFGVLAMYLFIVGLFYLIPGAQLELLELGRRWRVRPRHLALTCLLGAVGGFVFGGWAFLSNAYAMGGQSLRMTWAFSPVVSSFFSLNQWLTEATNNLSQPGTGYGYWLSPPFWAATGAAAATAATTLLRQVVAGFWFHPVGVLLAGTYLSAYIWGSALTAWVIRRVTLWMGGAAVVRQRLQPFFIGVLVGAVAAELLLAIHAGWLRGQGIERIYTVFTW